MKLHLVLRIILGVFVMAATALFMSVAPTENMASAQHEPRQAEPDGGGRFESLPMDEITAEQRREIQSQIQKNVARLERDGRLGAASPEVVAFSWPVRKAAGLADFNIDGISNYVDHNPAFPDQVLDWNCSNRTYDQASGYNHAGTDIFTWPFSWKKMDFNEVEVVAGAPGTIVFKTDGNFDRNCGFGSGNWNAIYVRHSDNSIAWYGHMKSGSLTTKIVGDTVVTGERLGVVGSSGNSTGPHLHFELYNASNQLQDPYQGTCNSLNAFTWWAAQDPYRVSRMNSLATQSAAPVFPTCPVQETTNEKNVFRPGETLVTAAYYRDQVTAQQTQYSLVRPDGTVFESWSHNSPSTYVASFWYWSRTLPTNAAKGAWKFLATYNAVTYEHLFTVSSNVPFDYDGDKKSDISVFRPSNGIWYLNRSTAGFFGVQFGASTDRIVPADYDGDGKTDIAVYRPADGVWFVVNSSNGVVDYRVFGLAEDIPAPADYDGDGKADICVFRPSTGTWYRQNSSNGSFFGIQFGVSGDRPTVGDFDGDGKADVGIWRPSNGDWYHIRSSNGTIFGERFGISTDKMVPADYDGDGKTDIAVWRPSSGIWYIKQSSNAAYLSYAFGLPTDLPAPGDFDGDGKTDRAVFRPSDGYWYITNSTTGLFTILPWGQGGDRPTPGAFGN